MRKKYLNLGVPFALVLGGVLGFFPATLPFAEVIGTLFINTLKLISLPMVFLAIVSTLSRMNSLEEAGVLLRKILKYTVATTLVAATIGLLLFLVIAPKAAAGMGGEVTHVQGSYLSFLSNLIPENLIAPFLENNVLGIALIAAVFGIAILKLPKETGKILSDLFGALFDALLKITSALIFVMPIGVFAFSAQFMGRIREDVDQLEKLMLYAACVIGANLIQGLFVLPALLKGKGVSPMKAARAMLPALAMAFFTKSSNATLPLSLECAKNRLGVSDKTARFSLPLCSVINMNGCAAFILITFLFVCTSQGMVFSPIEMILWVFLASFAAIGNAGVPMGCFFLTMAFLIGVGASTEIMGSILLLYSLFDMVETALNVWSDSCVTAVVDKELSPQCTTTFAEKT